MAKTEGVFLSLFLLTTLHFTIASRFKPDYEGSKKEFKKDNIRKKSFTVMADPNLPDAVSDFNEAFKLEVRNCENLTQMFDLDGKLTPSEFYSGTEYISTAVIADKGSKYSSENAILVTRNIPSNCKKLGDDLMIALYADSMAKSLYSQRRLNRKNARNLAKSYSDEMKSIYKKVVNENYPRSKVSALSIAYSTFLERQFGLVKALRSTFCKIYGDEWLFQAEIGNIPDADKVLPPVKNPDVNPLLKPDPNACHVSKAVQQFHHFFQNAVTSSKILSNLFELNPLVTFSKGAEYMNVFLLQKYGVKDAAILADFMSKYVDDEKAKKSDDLVSFVAKFMGKYLESEIILNCSNAGKLASRFSKVLKTTAEFILKERHPKSNIVAMMFGMFEFLRDLRAFDISRAKKLAFYYGNEWKCLASKQ